jgi:hypothetical protein
MNSKDFIEEKLNELFSKFEGIQIRYEYRVTTHSHIVEVIPLSFFQSNADYMEFEARFEEEFERLFKNENIVFVSQDSLTEIKQAHFELGQEEIILDIGISNAEVEVSGYSESVPVLECNYYALAA